MLWDDDVSQWVALDTEGNEMASIRLTWATSDRLDAWTIETPDYTSEMRLKWRDDPNLWEMNVNGQWIEAQTLLNNQLDRWRIKIGNERYTFQRAWPGRWEIRSTNADRWVTEIQFTGDLRDWVVDSNVEVWPEGLEYLLVMLAITTELEIR